MPKLRHFDNLGTARAINFSCFRRLRLLQTEHEIMPFIDELNMARLRYGFSILGYVIMPSHAHLILYSPDNIQFGRIIGEIKARSAGRILRYWQAIKSANLERVSCKRNGQETYSFWQPRCYDHNCREPNAVHEKIHYCHNNPVKAGLVENPEDWPWSSYCWYNDLGGVVLEMDGIDLL